MNKHETQIEDWLTGALEAEDKDTFEKALRDDAGLAAAVEAHRTMLMRLEGMRLRAKTDDALREISLHALPADRSAWSVWWWIGTAILVLALSGSAYYVFKKNSGGDPPAARPPVVPPASVTRPDPMEKPAVSVVQAPKKPLPAPEKSAVAAYRALAQAYYMAPAPSHLRTAAGDESLPATVRSAESAFSDHQYAEVCTLLADESKWDETAGRLRFLRACSRFKTGDYSGAARDFAHLEDGFQYRQEARWHLMLCALGQGALPAARQMLDDMIQDANFAYRERAVELSGKIK